MRLFIPIEKPQDKRQYVSGYVMERRGYVDFTTRYLIFFGMRLSDSGFFNKYSTNKQLLFLSKNGEVISVESNHTCDSCGFAFKSSKHLRFFI